MVRSDKTSPFHTDEFTRIFDEYRAKIDEITRKTEKSLQAINVVSDVVDDPDIPAEVEDERPVETVSQVEVELEPDKRPVEVIWPSEKESVEIIKEAKRKAQQLISQAEESIRKEAKKKTQAQVDKIIGKAKKEAEVIVARALQTAEREIENAIVTSKSEAEQLLKEITEKCREEAREYSSRVIAGAREKAEKMMDDITMSATDVSRIVTEIVDRAKKTINEFEGKLQEETDELTKAITETQSKLEEVTMIGREEETSPEPAAKSREIREPYKNPSLTIHLLGHKSNGKHGHQALFSGKVEMKSSSAFDYQYLRNLKKYLVRMPNIKYLQEYASEKEMSVLFEVQEPLPLLDILTSVPLVDRVIKQTDDDLCVIFKTSL